MDYLKGWFGGGGDARKRDGEAENNEVRNIFGLGPARTQSGGGRRAVWGWPCTRPAPASWPP